jgi:hypothetical protein
VVLPPVVSHLKYTHKNENSKKRKTNRQSKYVYPVKLRHQQAEVGENYYQSSKYAHEGPTSSIINMVSFAAFASSVGSSFVACAIKRRALLNTNRGVVCAGGPTFSTVN